VNQRASFLLSMFALALAGCQGAAEKRDGTMEAAETGAIAFHMVNLDENIVAFQFKIFTHGQLVEDSVQWIHPQTLPAAFIPGVSGTHPFADAYFTVPPGAYEVTVIPMMADIQNPGGILPSQQCTPAQASNVQVIEGQTTEIAVVTRCAEVGNGGLDVVVTVNHPPRIVDLAFQPSKFVVACQQLVAAVTVEDPEQDNLIYEWTIQGPAGVEYKFEPSWNSLRFTAKQPGDFTVTVKVCDTMPPPNQMCASLSFPIHVLLGADTNHNGIGDLCETQCVPDCRNRECGLDPICGTCCGTCPPEKICKLGTCMVPAPH